ncbi:hypothetical protein NPX13_g10913 [Xylaria arbuscula]|uniref:Uncharacterized protein n=1 Tax=Xylaria arbuscula TaxID=114810 RepID=A0A9W8N3W2_9PEZI|nr:hypothetical protein NPX13_g10913 [Xylaria arbuscula]
MLTSAEKQEFGAEHDGGDQGVETGEKSQADGADEGEEDGHAAEDLLGECRVGDQTALVTEQPVGDEGCVQEDGGEDRSHDEQRLQLGGAHIRDVGDGLAILLRRISSFVCVDDPVQEETEESGEPHKTRYYGKYLFEFLVSYVLCAATCRIVWPKSIEVMASPQSRQAVQSTYPVRDELHRDSAQQSRPCNSTGTSE